MDLCVAVNTEIDLLLEEYVEIPFFGTVFEEDTNPEVAAQSAKNADIEARSENILRRAIASVRKIFRAIKDTIKRAIDFLFAGKDEKAGFEQMCKELRDNPEFKGKRLTFHDYREIMKEYNDNLSKYEAEYKRFKDSEQEENPNLINTMQTKMKEVAAKGARVAKAEAKAFSIEATIAYAKQSREHAAKVYKMIEFDEALLGTLEAEMGKKEYRKYKKKIKRLKSRWNILAEIARHRRTEANTIENALKEVTGSVKNLYMVHRRAKKDPTGGKDVKDAGKMVRNVGMTAAKGAASGAISGAGDNILDRVTAKGKGKKLDAEKDKVDARNKDLDSQIDKKTQDITDNASKAAADKLRKKYGVKK